MTQVGPGVPGVFLVLEAVAHVVGTRRRQQAASGAGVAVAARALIKVADRAEGVEQPFHGVRVESELPGQAPGRVETLLDPGEEIVMECDQDGLGGAVGQDQFGELVEIGEERRGHEVLLDGERLFLE